MLAICNSNYQQIGHFSAKVNSTIILNNRQMSFQAKSLSSLKTITSENAQSFVAPAVERYLCSIQYYLFWQFVPLVN
jgi:hypothetical protein